MMKAGVNGPLQEWLLARDELLTLRYEWQEVIERRDSLISEWEKSLHARGLAFVPESKMPTEVLRQREKLLSPYFKSLANHIALEKRLHVKEQRLREVIRESYDWTDDEIEFAFNNRLSPQSSEEVHQLFHALGGKYVLRPEVKKLLSSKQKPQLPEEKERPEDPEETRKFKMWLYGPFLALSKMKRIELVTANDEVFGIWEESRYRPYTRRAIQRVKSLMLLHAGLDFRLAFPPFKIATEVERKWNRGELQKRLKAIAAEERFEGKISMKTVRRIARGFEREGYANNAESIRKTLVKLGFFIEG